MNWSSRIRSSRQARPGVVPGMAVKLIAVLVVMLLSTACPGEARAGKARDGAGQGAAKGAIDQVEGAFEGDRISQRDGFGDAGSSERRVTTAGATTGWETRPQRGAPVEVAGSAAFSATEINAIGLLSAVSIAAGVLGLMELFRRNAA